MVLLTRLFNPIMHGYVSCVRLLILYVVIMAVVIIISEFPLLLLVCYTSFAKWTDKVFNYTLNSLVA